MICGSCWKRSSVTSSLETVGSYCSWSLSSLMKNFHPEIPVSPSSHIPFTLLSSHLQMEMVLSQFRVHTLFGSCHQHFRCQPKFRSIPINGEFVIFSVVFSNSRIIKWVFNLVLTFIVDLFKRVARQNSRAPSTCSLHYRYGFHGA